MPKTSHEWRSLLWHAPGRLWAGMMAAASVSLWLTAGAAMAWTLMSVAFVIIFRDILTSDDAFWIIMVSQVITALAIAAMAGQEMTLRITRQGVNFNVGADDRHQFEVETKTTVTTTDAESDPTMYGGPRA